MDGNKPWCSGSAFLAGVFVLEKMTWKNQGALVSVPSRGFCFLGKHDLKRARVIGGAFLAGACDPW